MSLNVRHNLDLLISKLESHGIGISLVQFISIDRPEGDELQRNILGISEELVSEYEVATKVFTGEKSDHKNDKSEVPIRSLVFSQPSSYSYAYKPIHDYEVSRSYSWKKSAFKHDSLPIKPFNSKPPPDSLRNDTESLWNYLLVCIQKYINLELASGLFWVSELIDRKEIDKDEYYSSLFVLVKNKLKAHHQKLLYKECRRFIVSHAIDLFSESIRDKARRAAISQVFSRNGSHNIGSHVLAKMVTSEDVDNNYGLSSDISKNNYIPITELEK